MINRECNYKNEVSRQKLVIQKTASSGKSTCKNVWILWKK